MSCSELASSSAAAGASPRAASEPEPLCRAAAVTLPSQLGVGALVGCAAGAWLVFAEFWFREEHVGDPLTFTGLSLAIGFGLSRLALSYLGWLSLREASVRPAREGLRVAVFTTAAPGEPLGMVEVTLRALQKVRYPHTTYLLDGTGDPGFAEVARRHGAVPLDVVGVPGAKAGKINAALRVTDEPFILVLDPDHVPRPDFLDRVLGHFDDACVGFVQVAQGYYNQGRSPIARAAAEQTYAFYGPVQMGLYGLGAAVAIGANCTFRRQALSSIGGHAVGLAEDLLTSLRLHAAGWRSVYVPEILSRGLVPETLADFCKQQLKWATGAVDMLVDELPRHLTRLSWGQRITYLGIGTYYLGGVCAAISLALPYVALWFGLVPARVNASEFAVAGAPLVLCSVALHALGQYWLCDPATERGLHWRSMLLKLLCWPVYASGTWRAVAGRLVPYVPTRKLPSARRALAWHGAWLHLASIALFVVTALMLGSRRAKGALLDRLWQDAELFWALIAFGAVAASAQLGAMAWASSGRRAPSEPPWHELATVVEVRS